MRNSIIILSAFIFISFSAVGQSVEEIVQLHINAMGGAEKLASLKSVKMEGNINAQGLDIGLTITKKQDIGMRIDMEIMGTSNYQVINTKKGSVFMPAMQQTDPQEMPENQFKGGLRQLDLQGSFINYKARGYKIDYVGDEKINGNNTYHVKVNKAGDITDYFIDATTGYIVQSISKLTGAASDTDVVTSYSNYKKNNDGFVFPYSISNIQGDISFDKISTNIAVEDVLFDN